LPASLRLLKEGPHLGAHGLLVGERVMVHLEAPERAAMSVQQAMVVVDEARRYQGAGRLHRVARIEDDLAALAHLPQRRDRE
jgi:hypothetical protein